MIKILTTPLPATWRALNVGFTTSINSLTTCHVVLPIQSGCVMATATTVCSSQTVATSGRILSIAPMLGTVACDTDSRVYRVVDYSQHLRASQSRRPSLAAVKMPGRSVRLISDGSSIASTWCRVLLPSQDCATSDGEGGVLEGILLTT